jgi:anti-anti-sigma factor
LKNNKIKIGMLHALVKSYIKGDSIMELRKIDLDTTTLTLSIFGNLDAAGSREAQADIDDVISNYGHQEIEVDFSQVQFLDSSGVGAIVYMFKRLTERERNMRLENVSGQPLEIMQLLRIGHAIPVNSKNPTNS